MTSNILPSPYAAYSSTEYDGSWMPWRAFDSTSAAWATSSGIKTGWLLLQLDAARAVTKYILKAHTSYYTLAPKDFTLQGATIISPMNMTADTTGSYIASASTVYENAENRKPWNAFGSNHGDPWASGASVNTGWLKIDLNTGQTAVGYAVKAHHLWYSGAPNDFTLQGSNNNIDWTTLNTQTDQVFSAAETKTYTFSNSTSYRYYKLDVTQNNGGSEVVVGEMYLFSANWATLDTQTGQTFDVDNQTRTYEFSNSTSYKHYKLDVTDITAASGEITLGELELYA